jgi:cell division protein FtsB
MEQVMEPRSKTMNPQPAPSRLRRQGFLETLVLELALSVLVLLVVPAILGGKNLPAQTHVPQATKPAQQQEAAAQPRRRSATHAPAASTQRQPAPEAIAAQPPAPPAPISPANQPPNQAKVSWDSRGLEIEASNSSLDQILHQVAAATGAKLEGLTQDQRVFGSYGPGPECDVLSKLLDGSGYNVLMIGSRGTGAPLEIVLSARSPASPQMAANNQNRSISKDDEASAQLKPEPPRDYPPEPPHPQPTQNPFANGEPPPDPLQFMQEILQRQQVIDQQQQQQHDQQNNPQQRQ